MKMYLAYCYFLIALTKHKSTFLIPFFCIFTVAARFTPPLMARQATPLQQMWQKLLSRSESGKLSRKNAVNILPKETVVLASLHFPLSNSYTCVNVYVGSIMPSPIIVIQTGQNCPSEGIESIFGLAIPTVATYTL